MGGHSGCRKRGEVFETSYARTDPVDSCLFKNRANPGLTDFEWVTLFLNINPIRLSNQVFFFLFFFYNWEMGMINSTPHYISCQAWPITGYCGHVGNEPVVVRFSLSLSLSLCLYNK